MHFIWYKNLSIFPQFMSFIRNFKKRHSFYDVFKMTSPSEFLKQNGPIIPIELQAAHIAYDFLSILWLLYETFVDIRHLCPPHTNFFS